MKLTHRIWKLLFPTKCILCREILSREELDLCHTCRRKAPQWNGQRDKLRFIQEYTAVWYYESDVRQSLIRYKFRNARHYCESYGRMVAMRVNQDLPEQIDLVTWIPISRRRKWKRGYDQCELLAQAVGRELEIPVQRLLVKKRDNKHQSSLKSAGERRANVLGVYEICNGDWVEGRNILLLDDIITTGATASEGARMLQGAGARNVYCAAVAAGRNQKQ